MIKAIKNINKVRINLSPINAGNGFSPKKEPSKAKEEKFKTAMAHK